jgi:redox-sensitive bicupin YhaK (pirin superfamily)
MYKIRRSAERGHFNHGWLDTFHTFSFGDYRDPAHTHFRALRVMNEDRIAPGAGFPPHSHRDMEIITYVLAGSLRHQDDFSHGAVIEAGQWQRMSAGSGIVHSEFNPSPSEPTHLYQIWLMPEVKGVRPEYEDRTFDVAELHEGWQLVASGDGRDDSMHIHQDVDLYTARAAIGAELVHELAPPRYGWLQVLRGRVSFGEDELAAGDGLAADAGTPLAVVAEEDSEVLLFDLG